MRFAPDSRAESEKGGLRPHSPRQGIPRRSTMKHSSKRRSVMLTFLIFISLTPISLRCRLPGRHVLTQEEFWK